MSSVMVQVAGVVSSPGSSRSPAVCPFCLTVLIVEDDPALLRVTADVFEDERHHVLTASDAVTALALLASNSVDLLFTDIDLARGTNGIALAREARGLRPGLMVAYASGRNLPAEHMLPNSVFLPKPYRIAELLELPKRLSSFRASTRTATLPD